MKLLVIVENVSLFFFNKMKRKTLRRKMFQLTLALRRKNVQNVCACISCRSNIRSELLVLHIFTHAHVEFPKRKRILTFLCIFSETWTTSG